MILFGVTRTAALAALPRFGISQLWHNPAARFHQHRRAVEPNEQYSGIRKGTKSFVDGQLGKTLKPRQWGQDLDKICKNIYSPAPSALNCTAEEVAEFRRTNRISLVRGADIVPSPVRTFEEAGFSPKILSTLSKTDFTEPMPIQSQGWPIALSGLDLISIGQTGSGKTLGYILPALEHIRAQPSGHRLGPTALVLAPTRELVQQITTVAHNFGRLVGVRPVSVFGGVSKLPQINAIQSGASLVVATPGRLIDLLEAECVRFDSCSYVVLDEADRCLDMGFEPQIRKIFEQLRPDRQLQMWSATWPEEVKKLAEDFFNSSSFVHLNIGSAELQANHNITQHIALVSRHEKLDRLQSLLKSIREENAGEEPKVLIFAETKSTVDFLEKILHRNRFSVEAIHGGKTQRARDYILSGFRSGQSHILVATNVVARGLDVEDIKYVINFDFPAQIEDYVHRIGRTGRRHHLGQSYSFLTESDAHLSDDLIRVLTEANQIVPEELRQLSQQVQLQERQKSRYRSASRSPFHKREREPRRW